MIIFVLRHADRVSETVDALSEKGNVRAKLLARMLAQSHVSNAYCSDAKRTRATIAPLEAKLGAQLKVEEVPVGEDTSAHVQAIVTALQALPADSTAAVIGHSNTIGKIIKALTGEVITPIGLSEFDNMFVFSIPPGSPSVTLLKYGAPTP